MQPEHRGYSRCSDFFMCVRLWRRRAANESAALTIINVDAAPRIPEPQAITKIRP